MQVSNRVFGAGPESILSDCIKFIKLLRLGRVLRVVNICLP